jgi:hypothetical protein
MLFPFGLGCNFTETGDSTNGGRFLGGCANRMSLGGDQELSSFIRMIPVLKVIPSFVRMKLAKEIVSAISGPAAVAMGILKIGWRGEGRQTLGPW